MTHHLLPLKTTFRSSQGDCSGRAVKQGLEESSKKSKLVDPESELDNSEPPSPIKGSMKALDD